MGFIWFWIVAVMLAAYVVLDGFDLGVGILHPLLARSESDRQIMLRSIGPVWDGNEVWLLAGGGTLYFAFPALYASAFSGFYLALMIVLWLLIMRGASIELRMHIDDRLWRSFFDGLFFLSSSAAGRVLRRGSGQCDSRRAASRGRLFLSSALDQLAGWTSTRHSGLVHRHRRSGRSGGFGHSRRALSGREDRG